MTRDRLGFRRQTETAMEPAFAELKSIRPGKKKQVSWAGGVGIKCSALRMEVLTLFFFFPPIYDRIWPAHLDSCPFFFIFYTHRAELWSQHAALSFLSLSFRLIRFHAVFFLFSAWQIMKDLWCFLRLFFNLNWQQVENLTSVKDTQFAALFSLRCEKCKKNLKKIRSTHFVPPPSIY